MSAITSPSSSPRPTPRRATQRRRSIVDYGVLPAVTDLKKAIGAATIHDAAPDNTVYNWHLGDKAATDAAFAKAAHVTKIDLVNNRLIPNPMEPRAAIGEYDSGTDALTLYTTSQNPHVARLVLSAFIGLAPEHKFRVIAPDVGGGFGSKIFIYAEETVCAWAARKIDRPVKWTSDRTEAFLSDAHGRDHVTHCRTRARRQRQDHRHARAHDRQPRRLSLDVRLAGADVPLCAAAVGPVQHPGDLCGGRRRLHDHRAGRRLSRRRPAGSDLRHRTAGGGRRARESGCDPAEFRRQNFVTAVPASDAGHHELRRRRLRRPRSTRRSRLPTTRVCRRARRPRPPRASCAASASPPSSRPAASARRAPSPRWAAASAAGNWRKSGSIRSARVEVLTGSHSHGQGHETTFAQLVVDRLGIPDRECHRSSTATPTRCSSAWEPTAPAPGRSACRRSSRRSTRSRPRRRRSPAMCSRRASRTSSSRTASSPSRAPTSRSTSARSRCNAYIAHKFDGNQIEPGLKESAFWEPTNFTFPAGVHICEVEIDPDTGVTTIERYTAVDDFGKQINPMVVHGQVHGGIAQGVGQAMLEGAVYNEDGQLVTASYMDYCMPRADNLPVLRRRQHRDGDGRPTRSASRAAARPARSPRRRR